MKWNSVAANTDGRSEGVIMDPSKAKTIVYCYNEDPKSDEEEFDLDGEFTVPERDEMIVRQGKLWRTVRATWHIGSSGQIPIVRVFLTDLNIY